MCTLIVTGGCAPRKLCIPMGYDRVIACDSGYDSAVRLGIAVDEVVGDLDSTQLRSQLLSSGVVPCSHDKDESDTELALLRLPRPRLYDLIGGGGGRLDHLVALFASFARYGCPRFWFTDSDAIAHLSGHFRFNLPDGTAVSFFAPAGTAIVECADLVWPLNGFVLDSVHISLSNRSRGKTIVGTVEGDAFMRLPLECAPLLFAQEADRR